MGQHDMGSRGQLRHVALASTGACDPARSAGHHLLGQRGVDHDNTAGFGAGTLVCLYTAAGGTSEESKGQPFTQCLAYSTDGRTFTKYAGNPVLKQLVGGNRDPKVIWHQPSRRWIMVLYLDKNDFAFYTSPNLKDWAHLQTMTVPNCTECPDFFPMAVDDDPARTKWVWTAANGRYLVGEFDGQRFVPDEPTARPLASEHYYAVQTFSDLPDGRRIQMPWHIGVDFPGMPFNQQLGLPVELTLRDSGGGLRLCAIPIRELDNLRVWGRVWENSVLAAETPFVVPLQFQSGVRDGGTGRIESAKGTDADITAAGYDVKVVVIVGGAQQIEFGLCGITLNWSRATQCLNGKMPLQVRNGTILFRALVDRASVEVFADGGEAIMVVGGMTRMDDPQVRIAAQGGSAKLERLEVFGLCSVWPTVKRSHWSDEPLTAKKE